MHPSSIPPHSGCLPSRTKDLFPHTVLILPRGSELVLICAGITKYKKIFNFFFQRNTKMLQILDLLGKKFKIFSVDFCRTEMLLSI